MSDKTLLFELHGFRVMSDSTYLVADKMDYNAPTGLQEKGVTKIPSDGVGNTFQCPYKKTSSKDGIWDTGFYEHSPCYSGRSKEEVKIIVKTLQKTVVDPYRSFIGKPEALQQHDNEFFDSHMWMVEEGQVFKTDNPEHVLALYFALRNRELVPKKLKGDSAFADAAYVIIDIGEKLKKRDEDASSMFKAIGVFEVLYANDQPKLDTILYYINRNMAEGTSVDAYRGMFKAYLESSPANIETFNKIVEESDSETGMAKLNIYYALKSRNIKNSKVSKGSAGTIFYESTEVGVDLKAAAENIAKRSDLADIKREILLGDEDED